MPRQQTKSGPGVRPEPPRVDQETEEAGLLVRDSATLVYGLFQIKRSSKGKRYPRLDIRRLRSAGTTNRTLNNPR
jgi:hypothetical protein